MPALYQIAQQYRNDLALVMEADLDEQTLADTLEAISGDLEEKATNVAFAVRNMEATVEAMKEAERQMKARRETAERRIESVKRYLKETLESCGVKKVHSPWFDLAIQSNPEAVEVFDEAQLPGEYMTQPEPPAPKPDKAAIKAALKEGKDVPGAKLVKGTRLVIR